MTVINDFDIIWRWGDVFRHKTQPVSIIMLHSWCLLTSEILLCYVQNNDTRSEYWVMKFLPQIKQTTLTYDRCLYIYKILISCLLLVPWHLYFKWTKNWKDLKKTLLWGTIFSEKCFSCTILIFHKSYLWPFVEGS